MKEILDSSIESQIVRLLKSGSLSATNIVDKIQVNRPNTPKQSVYLAIRKLKNKEIVAIAKKQVSLHQAWIYKMKNFFANINSTNFNSNEASVLKLQEKEYISYNFNSLLSLDMFWAHAFALFAGVLSKSSSIFLYNPHEWFLIARKQSELSLMKDIGRKGMFWLQLIGNRKALDVEIKKYFDGESTKCYLLDKSAFPNNYYVNCFGDFLIEVWLDEGATNEIEKVYASYEKINDEVINFFQKIIEDKKYRHKMRISRNSKRALGVKKLFGKYFVI